MPHALSGRNAAFLLGVSLSKKGSTVTFLYVLASISSSSIELIESVTELVGWRTDIVVSSQSPPLFRGVCRALGGKDPLSGGGSFADPLRLSRSI